MAWPGANLVPAPKRRRIVSDRRSDDGKRRAEIFLMDVGLKILRGSRGALVISCFVARCACPRKERDTVCGGGVVAAKGRLRFVIDGKNDGIKRRDQIIRRRDSKKDEMKRSEGGIDPLSGLVLAESFLVCRRGCGSRTRANAGEGSKVKDKKGDPE